VAKDKIMERIDEIIKFTTQKKRANDKHINYIQKFRINLILFHRFHQYPKKLHLKVILEQWLEKGGYIAT
jgi:hypothetical protein